MAIARPELDCGMRKVTQEAVIAVDKAGLVAASAFGHRPPAESYGVSACSWSRSGLVEHPAEQRDARPDRKRKAGSPQPIAACGLARRRPHPIAKLPAPSARRAACVQRRRSRRPRRGDNSAARPLRRAFAAAALAM